jgi:hypothetical protein
MAIPAVTNPQREEFFTLLKNREISYTHYLILKLPEGLQNGAWKANLFVKQCSVVVDRIGVPFNVVPFSKLQADDKAWIILATVVATFVSGLPIWVACSSALVLLVKRPEPSQEPIGEEELQNQKATKLLETYKNNPSLLAQHIKILGATLADQLKILGELSSPDESFKAKFYDFSLTLDTYINIIANFGGSTQKEIYDFLYDAEKGVMGIYSDAWRKAAFGEEISMPNCPFIDRCTEDNDTSTVKFYNGYRKIEISQESEKYLSLVFTLIYGSKGTPGDAKSSAWVVENERMVAGVDAFYLLNNSADKVQDDMTVYLENKTTDRGLRPVLRDKSKEIAELGYVPPLDCFKEKVNQYVVNYLDQCRKQHLDEGREQPLEYPKIEYSKIDYPLELVVFEDKILGTKP